MKENQKKKIVNHGHYHGMYNLFILLRIIHYVIHYYVIILFRCIDTNDEERDKGKTVEYGKAFFETEKKVG